jgi:hypothetical protein
MHPTQQLQTFSFLQKNKRVDFDKQKIFFRYVVTKKQTSFNMSLLIGNIQFKLSSFRSSLSAIGSTMDSFCVFQNVTKTQSSKTKTLKYLFTPAFILPNMMISYKNYTVMGEGLVMRLKQ